MLMQWVNENLLATITENKMSNREDRRRHERIAAQNKPLTLISVKTRSTLYLLPIDESKGGIGCLYTGKYPPQIGFQYELKESHGEQAVEVRWVTEPIVGIYRIGLEYI
jgi:hypothetical protein